MSRLLIDLSPDLKRLQDEGYSIQIKEGYLLVHGVPYVNSEKSVMRGILVEKLELVGNKTVQPPQHFLYFWGQTPCQKDGTVYQAIISNSQDQEFTDGVNVNHTLSAKLREGQDTDYHHKITRYIDLLSVEAEALDPNVTAKNFPVIKSEDEDSIFYYHDTNSSRADILSISSKLKGLKVAIVGLGGTGSYILDFVAKTWVQEIHLFDGDEFLQHNAFRSPGAPSIKELEQQYKKVTYLYQTYSKMRKNIIPHEFHVSEITLDELITMDFVFICIDTSEIKKLIIDKLISSSIKFIDVGMGIQVVDDKLRGSVRVTTVTPEKHDHVGKTISYATEEVGEYSKNIQIAEINGLNAAMAVIKWKKLYGYYHDFEEEYDSLYNIDVNQLLNDDDSSA